MTDLRPTARLIQALRCVRLLLHFLWAAFLVATAYPFISGSRRLWLKQNWSRQLLEILGVKLDAHLTGIASGSLIVSNHISWLDIYALNAARPAAFVSKAEIGCWPLIGWLARNTDTVFLRRDSRRHAKIVNQEIGELLGNNKDVVIFPEGTTTDGTKLLKFHSALLQSAIDAGRPVQPVALAYYDASGQRSLAPAYAGETTMGECVAAILASRNLTVRLRPTPHLETCDQRRSELAKTAQGAIAFTLGVSPVHESNDVTPQTESSGDLSTATTSGLRAE